MNKLRIGEDHQKKVNEVGAKGKALGELAVGTVVKKVGNAADVVGAKDSRNVKISAVVDIAREEGRDDVEVVVRAIKTELKAFEFLMQSDMANQYIHDAVSLRATAAVNDLADDYRSRAGAPLKLDSVISTRSTKREERSPPEDMTSMRSLT